MMSPSVLRIPLVILFTATTAAAGVAVGDSPQLKARSVEGADVDLSTMRGRIVLIDFWVGRSEPQKSDERKLADIFKEYHAKGLEIIGICCERRLSDVARYMTELKITWPQVHEPADWRGGLGVQWGVPRVDWDYLIAPDGKVIYAGDAANIRDQIADAMTKHPPRLVEPQVLAKANEGL